MKYKLEVRNRATKEWEIRKEINSKSRRQAMLDGEVVACKKNREQFKVRV